jgi:hypothetical protein
MTNYLKRVVETTQWTVSKNYNLIYEFIKCFIYPLVWTALYTYQTHMQSFHAAWSWRDATVRMVARSAERMRVRSGTQNSSTPPSIENFQLRTVDTAHESSPGTPTITQRCGSSWKPHIFSKVLCEATGKVETWSQHNTMPLSGTYAES